MEAILSSPFALVEPASDAWDAFVRHHQYGHLLQSSGWGELKRQAGWEPRLVAVADTSGIRAGALLLIRRRYGLSAAYIPRGPLLSGDIAIDTLLFNRLERIARAARAVFLRLEPNLPENAPGASALHSTLLVRDYHPTPPLQPRSSIHLDLAAPPDRLLAAMSKGHRADIRRAARDGVSVRWGSTSADFDAFYSIYQDTSKRADFGIHSRAYYEAVCRLFGEGARLWLAEQAGEPQATAITTAWGSAALYLYSGSTDAGLKSGAQHAIQWQVIQWAHERGCMLYDFWGIPDQFGLAALAETPEERAAFETAARSDPLYGVYRFKKGFGGQVVRYLPAYDRIYMPQFYAIWQRRMSGS